MRGPQPFLKTGEYSKALVELSSKFRRFFNGKLIGGEANSMWHASYEWRNPRIT